MDRKSKIPQELNTQNSKREIYQHHIKEGARKALENPVGDPYDGITATPEQKELINGLVGDQQVIDLFQNALASWAKKARDTGNPDTTINDILHRERDQTPSSFTPREKAAAEKANFDLEDFQRDQREVTIFMNHGQELLYPTLAAVTSQLEEKMQNKSESLRNETFETIYSGLDSNIKSQYDLEYHAWMHQQEALLGTESDASSSHKVSYDRFGDQTLAGHGGVFPKINLDSITNPTEKQAHNYVLHHCAQAYHEKATQIHAHILKHYLVSQIHYSFYGTSSEGFTQLVAIHDTHNNAILVGPSLLALNTQFRINTSIEHLYPRIDIQKVSEHLQSGGSVQWALSGISEPLYKYKEKYQSKTGPTKIGPIKLYLTDNHTQLALDYGGNPDSMSRLYTTSKQRRKTIGPWTLPDGAWTSQNDMVPEQSQARSSQKPKHGDILKFE